jgi:hypothetical protein
MKALGLAAGAAAGFAQAKRQKELDAERRDDRALLNKLRAAELARLGGGASSMPTPAARGTVGMNEEDIAAAESAAGSAPNGLSMMGVEEENYAHGGLIGAPNASKTSISWQKQSFKK